MSLRSRIALLKGALGTADTPKHVVISTGSDRCGIAWRGPDSLRLSIPYPGSPRRLSRVLDPDGRPHR